MPSDTLPPPPCRDPARVPPEQRIGLVVEAQPGQPYEHFCSTCGERGSFGFRKPHQPDVPDRWYCGAHRADGEAWWRAG